MNHRRELELYRKAFCRIDRQDRDALLRWFQSTPELSTIDRASIAGVTPQTIRRWRRALGLTSPTVRRPPRRIPHLDSLQAPPDWDNPEWLASVYGPYSTRQIGRAVGRHHRTIQQRLRRWGITKRTPEHPCNNLRWIGEHYVRRGYSQQRCATLAGVSREQFQNWLTYHQVPVRGFQQAAKNPHLAQPLIWIKRMALLLDAHPEVRRVDLMDRGVRVRYRTGIKEYYRVDRLGHCRRSWGVRRPDTRLQYVPPVHQQYPAPLANPYPAHLIVERGDLQRASLLERRVAVHTLARRLHAQGWVQPVLPRELLQYELLQIQEAAGRHLTDGTLHAFANLGPNRLPNWGITTHFFDLRPELGRFWAHPRKLFRAVELADRKDLELCTLEVIRIACWLTGTRVFSPGLYLWVLRHMGVRGTVLDLHPGLGHKAVACALLGLRYRTPPEERFQRAMDAGLGELLGLDWGLDDGGPVDLVIGDGGFVATDVAGALAHAERANRIVGFCRHGELEAVQAEWEPERVMKVKTRLHSRHHDYLLVW